MPQVRTKKKSKTSRILLPLLLILLCLSLTALTVVLTRPREPEGEAPALPSSPVPVQPSALPSPSAPGNLAGPSAEDPLLVLVNREHGLPDSYRVELRELEAFPQSIAAVAYEDLHAMLSQGVSQGLSFIVCSGYRSRAQQEALFREDCRKYLEMGLDPSQARAAAAVYTMPPGHSEHETGLAADIVSADYQLLDEAQADTPETRWLNAHCHEFGFILRYPPGKEEITGVGAESWHYRYVGREAAAWLHSRELTLEEFHSLSGS